ncbi:uncharacterized protein At3g27210-like isoform X1 [Syzygium oleosum]|uniref:uncharacterized protein At3g27210-like isoform X1 n=1 Tax=Syzygium oleosum TaxID=219896 RepID=UPI0024BBBDC3|nr:uncharacterized protein At3g27210-like isoform X1 [Syzygium oleosum]
MGSCVSAQRSSSLESAVKRSLSSASRMEKPAVAPPLAAASEVPVAAAGMVVGVPLGSRRTLTFSDFGSKEDNFFDSQAWMESDCEDEFFSVKGDFTPSRGNTPVHDSFFTSTPQRITTFFKDETLGSIPKPIPADGKKKLAELFQESFQGGQRINGDNKFSNNPTNPARGISSASGANSVHSSKRTAGGSSTIVEEKHVTPFQGCLSSLVSCGGSSKRRRKMTPAAAIHDFWLLQLVSLFILCCQYDTRKPYAF